MRLIDADALKESLEIWEDYDELFVGNIRKHIDDAPTIEPQLEQRWIPCSERLPEECGNYLATMKYGDVQECTYSPETRFMRGCWSTCESDGILFLDVSEVVAWMPLPEPYTERRKE